MIVLHVYRHQPQALLFSHVLRAVCTFVAAVTLGVLFYQTWLYRKEHAPFKVAFAMPLLLLGLVAANMLQSEIELWNYGLTGRLVVSEFVILLDLIVTTQVRDLLAVRQEADADERAWIRRHLMGRHAGQDDT